MKTKSIFLVLLIVVFCMPVQAQINVKKLGSQIKRSAEQQVEQKVKEKAARETRKALDKGEKKMDQGVSNATSGESYRDKKEDAYDTKKEYNPGAEAPAADPKVSDEDSKANKADENNNKKKNTPSAQTLAADPKASDQTVEPGFTKSISEIHAAYEQLDPKVFTYQPYYEYKVFYNVHDKSTEDFRVREFNSLIANIASLGPLNYYPVNYLKIKTPDGNLLVTMDELFRNAWTAQFVADPMSSEAFDKFTKALMFGNQIFEAKIYYEMDDPDKGVVHAKTGELLIAPSRSIYESRQDRREEAGLSLARNVVSMDYVRTYLKDLFKQFNTETDAVVKYKLYWQIDAVMLDIFRKHKDYNSSDVANRQIEASYSAMESQRMDVESDARLSNAKPVEMPKGVSIDAATSAKVNGMAKEMLGAEYVKTIFLSSKWSEFQEDKYPYRVMHLSLPAAVIVKRADKYLMNYYDITKSPNGGEWNMMVKMGSSFQPVNYK